MSDVLVFLLFRQLPSHDLNFFISIFEKDAGNVLMRENFMKQALDHSATPHLFVLAIKILLSTLILPAKAQLLFQMAIGKL